MKKQHLIFGFQIFLTSILAILPFITQQKVDSTSNAFLRLIIEFTFLHNLEIAIIVSILLAVITGSNNIYFPKRFAKNARHSIMETLLEELFENNQRDIRITIFKDAGASRNFYLNMKNVLSNIFGMLKILFMNIVRHRREKIRFSFEKMWGKYIYVWERIGLEYPKSRTYFYYSMKTGHDCQGFAGRVRHDLASLDASNLPDIESIDLDSLNLSSRSNDAKNVREYMERGYIKDFKTLKRINRRAKHFYGTVIFNKKGEPKGVLIIDSLQPDSPFNEQIKSKLFFYSKIIGYTF